MAHRGDDVLNPLHLPDALRERILCLHSPEQENKHEPPKTENNATTTKESSLFVLYLPTVVLRKRHNPGFSLACRLANQHNVPLIVLCTVLDDHHLSQKPLLDLQICMTSRRLAFILEALQSCTQEWEDHSAGVAVRVHGPRARTPHHLSLLHKGAVAVVTDEPFVEPYRIYVRSVAERCVSANIPCFSVDGSTTVPPASKLKRVHPSRSSSGEPQFTGVPAKAWIWEKNTTAARKVHIEDTCNKGHLDAPELRRKLPAGFFLHPNEEAQISNAMPTSWRLESNEAPGKRPWTTEELGRIKDLKHWSMCCWEGADASVAPTKLSHGSGAEACRRWKTFLATGISSYAKQRNQIVHPHAVSRMSCYLNLGIISIFDVVNDVWKAKAAKNGVSNGCDKFLEEVVKWREIGYVHTFATPGYISKNVIPRWSQTYLRKQLEKASSQMAQSFDLLDSANTSDKTWNAMQKYLRENGELHNNARMTWGRTIVHWQCSDFDVQDVLWQICCLNDRYALDGLAPPSYAGILWCFGWCDKPRDGKALPTKWARNYRTGPDGFERATRNLVTPSPTSSMQSISRFTTTSHSKRPKDQEFVTPPKKARTLFPRGTDTKDVPSKQKGIAAFFLAKPKK